MQPNRKSNILLLNPFHTGSHRRWAEGLINHSKHNIHLLHLPGRHWKWRMHGAAVHFAGLTDQIPFVPDLVLSTDMMDMSTFRALTQARWPKTKYYCYFHENQISYPWSPTDQDVALKRDYHYAFINFTTALASDRLFFNSRYHLSSFLEGVQEMLSHFPDHTNRKTVIEISEKATVLFLGMDLGKARLPNPPSNEPVLLWNHRWEYDKNPEAFFDALFNLKKEGIGFKLIVTGESFQASPAIFEKARKVLKDRIIHFGFAASKKEYDKLLQNADLLPVSNIQDFFGGSIIEAINTGVLPLLPNRLAYPEHIPDWLKSKFLYNEQEGLTNALLRVLNDYENYNKDFSLVQAWIKRYAWEEMIKAYDTAFE